MQLEIKLSIQEKGCAVHEKLQQDKRRTHQMLDTTVDLKFVVHLTSIQISSNNFHNY